jgi:uncharacterized protein (TIGR02271 family)
MAINQQPVIVALFEDRAMAEQAATELKQAGFSGDQIEFAGHGAGTGGGLLAGLKSLFTGGDTGTSDVYEDLIDMGMPAEDARHYQGEYEAGRSIVGVSDESRLQEASTILTRFGGYGANRRAAPQAANNETAVDPSPHESLDDLQDTRRVQLREEQLQVYKKPVQTGEARVRKEVVSEQKTMDVPVTREEVYIERHPASGPSSDTPIGEGESIRVPVSEEKVNVSKQTVETGEIALRKRQVQDTKQVSDTVRKEKAHVEREGDPAIHETRTDRYHPEQTDPKVEELLEDS